MYFSTVDSDTPSVRLSVYSFNSFLSIRCDQLRCKWGIQNPVGPTASIYATLLNSTKTPFNPSFRTWRNSFWTADVLSWKMASICVLRADETLQPGPLIANITTRFAWLIWSFITQEWKFIWLAFMVITQLLHCRVLKWEFSVNNDTFAPHLLQEDAVNSSRKILMRNKTEVKHNVE